MSEEQITLDRLNVWLRLNDTNCAIKFTSEEVVTKYGIKYSIFGNGHWNNGVYIGGNMLWSFKTLDGVKKYMEVLIKRNSEK